MGSKPTKNVLHSHDFTETTVQTIVDSSSSKSIGFEEVESRQPEPDDTLEMDKIFIRDVQYRLNHFDTELQKNNDTILLLNHTIETLTNQVILLSENIKRFDNHEVSSSSSASASDSDSTPESIQTQLYGLNRTFSITAASFEKGIRTLNYIVHTLIEHEGILVKYIDKLVSIITIYEQGKKEDDSDDNSDDSNESDESDV